MELGNSPPNKYSEIITKHLSKLFFNKVNNIKLKKENLSNNKIISEILLKIKNISGINIDIKFFENILRDDTIISEEFIEKLSKTELSDYKIVIEEELSKISNETCEFEINLEFLNKKLKSNYKIKEEAYFDLNKRLCKLDTNNYDKETENLLLNPVEIKDKFDRLNKKNQCYKNSLLYAWLCGDPTAIALSKFSYIDYVSICPTKKFVTNIDKQKKKE